MTDRKEIANGYFMQGYNCSQAVAMAFADVLDKDPSELSAIVVGLGGGIGRMREVCGAAGAMAVILGMVFDTGNPMSKNEVYPLVQNALTIFKERNGSYICRELLEGKVETVSAGGTAESRTPEFYKKRPCAMLVQDAVEILETIINRENG